MENITNKYDQQLLSKLGAMDPFRWMSKFFEEPIGMCLKEYERVGPKNPEVEVDDRRSQNDDGGNTDRLVVTSRAVKPAYATRSRIRQQEQQGLGTNLEELREESAEEERRLSREQRRKRKPP
ncbi:hypothetical protein HK102_010526, partial [Quaeritorhiza haematococci]